VSPDRSGSTARKRDVSGVAQELGLPLIDALDGHAGIESFASEGHEVATI
jgi:hypothetical protein